ncbi:hypothetical protein CHUAL_003765 [Chamberlinius hualienensis]
MEDGGCVVTVQEVADVLRAKHAIITGGKAKDGCPLITFPDNCTFCDLLDDDYRKLMIFLTTVPSFRSHPPILNINYRLLEADLGFVLIVDRRNDTWNAVKTALLKIGSYFPGLVQAVYVLRPSSFLQKAISEVRNKLFKEDFKFKLVVCNSADELHDYIDASQLTKDLNGFIEYDHEEWIEQRIAVEKFSKQSRDVSLNLWQFTNRLKETELPNDVESTKELLRVLKKESEDLKQNVRNITDQGEALLKMLRHPCTKSSTAITTCTSSMDICPESKLINVTTVERLLVQLDETEQGFDNFWRAREDMFHQCLELRRFEHKFREIQSNLARNCKVLNEMNDMGDSVARVDDLLTEANQFVEDTSDDIENAKQLKRIGEQLIDSKHYAVDSIQPKCVELQRFCDEFTVRLQKRLDSLWKYRDLQERVERANKWCTRGVDLLAGQQLERCTSPEFARSALEEVDTFLKSSSEFKLDNPREFRNFFKDMITPETTALVQQVLKRIDDVQTMCEKKKASLQKLAEKPSRPVQPVVPEPAVPLTNNHITDGSRNATTTSPETGAPNQSNGSWISSPSSLEWTDDPFDYENGTGGQITKKCIRKTRTLPKMRVIIKEPEFSSDTEDSETLLSKQKHVTKELLATERIYVAELNSVLQGYKMEMRNPHRRGSIPERFIGKDDILFGNMEEIHRFHNEIFLKDLENCIDTPELIGLCFIQRKEALHNLYTIYCQNKPKSEALRMDGGDSLPFLKECQKKLGHRLPLSAYLLTPVQRITKYQLLLKDLLKYSRDGRGKLELQEAVDCMLDVLKYVNDSMHQVAITGFTGFLSDLGRLLMQGSFSVWSDCKSDRLRDLRLKPMQRHLFLYEKAVLFCKKTGKTDDQVTYVFKHCLKTSQVGLTESLRGSKGEESRKFELWTPGRKEVYIIQAPTMDTKEEWVKEIKGVLMKQFAYLKGENIKQHSSKFRKISSLNGAKPIKEDDIPYTHRSKLTRTERWDYESSIRYSSKTVSEEELRTEFRLSKRTYNINMVSNDDRHRSLSRPRSKSMTSKSSSMASSKGDSDGNYIVEEKRKKEQNSENEVINERWSDVDYGSDSDEEDGDMFDGPSASGSNDHFSYFGRFVALSDYNAVDPHEVTLHEGDIVELLKVGCAGWWFVRIVGTETRGWAPGSYLERISKRNSRSSPSASSQDSSCSGLGSNIPRTTSKSSVSSSFSGTS